MSDSLLTLEVLAVDCQSSGANPAHGDLLELGWGITTGSAEVTRAIAEWIVRATTRPVTKPVRELTGWDESVRETSIEPLAAWSQLRDAARARGLARHIPTVIHFARFELGFLRHLHESTRAVAAEAAPVGAAPENAEPFPLDVICLHTIACRLFPSLPRRNLRALAGHLGGSPQIIRRAKGHVEATAHVWRAIVPRLAELGVQSWSDLKTWLEEPAPMSRPKKSARQFPISSDKRRTLPDGPGVYRFLRPNGDVLYVGKATSLKQRVKSHFTTGPRATERALEMLSQVHDIQVTPTATPLEAALLEADEIKRLDPPYNVHLRAADRAAWFATRDFSHAAPAVDREHPIGPLPSRFSVWGIAAIHALLLGEASTPRLRGAAVGVPPSLAPDEALFDDVWKQFAADELAGTTPARRRILDASARIIVSERPEEDEAAQAAAPEGWDAQTIRRYLERTVVGEGTLVRRARLLALLADAHVTFREADGGSTRVLVVTAGAIAAHEPRDVDVAPSVPPPPPPLRTRLAGFDAGRYDRLRVLATELRRVALQGGHVEVRVGRHRVRVDSATSSDVSRDALPSRTHPSSDSSLLGDA